MLAVGRDLRIGHTLSIEDVIRGESSFTRGLLRPGGRRHRDDRQQAKRLALFTPALDWIAGSYKLIALAVLEDLAGNQIGKPFEVDIFERIDSPDDIAETYRIPIAISRPSNP